MDGHRFARFIAAAEAGYLAASFPPHGLASATMPLSADWCDKAALVSILKLRAFPRGQQPTRPKSAGLRAARLDWRVLALRPRGTLTLGVGRASALADVRGRSGCTARTTRRPCGQPFPFAIWTVGCARPSDVISDRRIACPFIPAESTAGQAG